MMSDCDTCGLNDWEFIDGKACCSECGTCSQSVVKEEDQPGTPAVKREKRFKQDKQCPTNEGYKWIVEEGLTVVLKKYVQVLIKLGAPSQLSTTALQVWKQLLLSKKLTLYTKGKGQFYDGLMLPCLVSVLHVACLLLNLHFHPSDFIRWIREEHLPYISSLNVLPETWQKMSLFDGFFVVNSFFWPHHLHVRGATELYLDILQVKPKLDWDCSVIIKRQLEEMQLPADLADLVKQLCRMTLQNETPGKCAQISLCKDIFVMAAIIVSLKVLLGLDGVNGDTETVLLAEVPKRTFVWNDWVKYIELRRTLLKFVRPSQHEHLFRTCNNSDTRLFSSPTLYHFLVLDELKRSLDMIASKRKTSTWNCEPSFYPTWGPLYQYLRSHPESLPEDVRKVLCTNFNTETSIRKLMRGESGLSASTVKRVAYDRWLDGEKFNQYLVFTELDVDEGPLVDNAVSCEVLGDVTSSSYWRSTWDKKARERHHNAHVMSQHFPSIYLWLLELCAEVLYTSADDLQVHVDLIDSHVNKI